MKYTVEVKRGLSGAAVFISDETGGLRVFGGKCFPSTLIGSWRLTEEKCTEIIDELRRIRRALKRQNRKSECI